MKTTAIVLSAGFGKRMNSNIPKQYMDIDGKPLIYYTLKTFEESFIDNIILVTGKGDISYCREEIVEKYSFAKVTDIVIGGKERYHSVYNGLKAARGADYVFIHDGARPFLNNDALLRAYDCVSKTNACVLGVPVKDTIKVVDENLVIEATPNRKHLYSIQTPQTFAYELVMAAYEQLIQKENELLSKGVNITDDAMVVEYFSDTKVQVVMGDYQNIKVTTPEDLLIGKILLQKCQN